MPTQTATVYQQTWINRKLPTLTELRADKVAPLQPFSKMKDTKIKTMRTVRAISRHQGTRCIVANTESFNHHSGCKSDMFGIIDALAVESTCDRSLVVDSLGDYLHSFQSTQYRALQACATDWGPHIAKLRENIETCALWLSGGNTTLELWGWRKVKRKGRRVYRPRVQLITLDFLLDKEPADVVELFLD